MQEAMTIASAPRSTISFALDTALFPGHPPQPAAPPAGLHGAVPGLIFGGGHGGHLRGGTAPDRVIPSTDQI